MKINTHEENLIEGLIKEMKDIQWNIDYHAKKCNEYKVKMEIAEYTLRQLNKQENGYV